MSRAATGTSTATTLALSATLLVAAFASTEARADDHASASEDAAGLGAPEPGAHRARRAPPAPDATRDAADERPPWDGPRVELGYSHFVLPDGYGGGAVHAGAFGGYLSTSPVRLGAWAELGAREYQLDADDFLARASVIAGYQHVAFRPFLPYVGVVGTVGVAVGERYHTPESYLFGGAGLEVGADVNLVNNLWTGVGVAYLRVSMQGHGYDLFVLRLRVGL